MNLPTKRSDAKAAGSSRYFTGAPCKHGHIAERHTGDGSCVVCRDNRSREWSIKNIEKRRAISSAWKDRNKDSLRAQSSEAYKANPEKYRAQALRSYYKYREQRIESTKAWKEKNRNHVLAYSSQYAARHKEDRAASQRNRNAKQRQLGSHTAADVLKLLRLQRYKCASCHASVKHKYHVDHVMPLFLNGSNTKDNLQILCATCNVRKNKKDPIEWAQQNGRLL